MQGRNCPFKEGPSNGSFNGTPSNGTPLKKEPNHDAEKKKGIKKQPKVMKEANDDAEKKCIKKVKVKKEPTTYRHEEAGTTQLIGGWSEAAMMTQHLNGEESRKRLKLDHNDMDEKQRPAEDWFDEETELEGRQDYEADYKKVIDGLEHPCLHLRKDIAQMHPVIRGITLDDPMSNQELSFSGSNLFERAGRGAVERAGRELSDVPVASPECPKSFHLLPNFWQQMHRRRLRKKTNVTVPNIDIWGLDTHEHDEEEEDDFAPPHTYFDRRLNILFLSRFSLFVFYLSTKVKGIHPAPSPNCRSK